MTTSTNSTSSTHFSGSFTRLAAAPPATLSELVNFGAPPNLENYRPKPLSGEAGWNHVLAVLAANRDALDIKDADPIRESSMNWLLKLRQGRLDRIVAMKVGKFPASGDRGTRFLAGAARTANLNHPAIPKVHNFGILTQGELPFFIMELVEGQTLEEWLPELQAGGRHFDWRVGQGDHALRIIRDAALAIDHTHAQGVVHRNITPENLMVKSMGVRATPDRRTDMGGSVMVLGWGSFTHCEANDAIMKGSSQENSPPVHQRVSGVQRPLGHTSQDQTDHLIDSRTDDVRALGAALHRMACNRTLVELDAIVMKALTQSPSDGYPRAMDLAEDLGKFLDQRPVKAILELQSPLFNWAYCATKFAIRNRRFIAVIAAILVAIGCVAGVVYEMRGSLPQPRALQ